MYVSIDLGKTNTRVACSKDLKNIQQMEKFVTLPNLEEQKKVLKDTIARVVTGEQVKAVVVGMPGIIDRVGGAFYRVNTYPELNGQPFSAFTAGFLDKTTVFIENDALLAGFGEAVGGAGKEFDIVTYLTLSTGVGGVRICFKEIDSSYYYMEPGHQIIVQDGREDLFCGQKGCLQAYVSGPAFETNYKMKPEDCKDDAVWNDYSGIINILSMWSPEVVIIGGGLSQKFDFIYPGLIENLNRQNFFPVPEIRKSAFGDESGIYGGFSYINKFIEKAL
jgi:predicted NBD/HSP70 family sugar kinase